MSFNQIPQFACVVIAAVAVLATSYRPTSIYGKSYTAHSDCAGFTAEGELKFDTQMHHVRKTLHAQDASRFGFPSDDFEYEDRGTGSGNSALISKNEQRVCRSVMFLEEGNSVMFACSENDTLVCTILLSK